ncbi:hypothetical protein LIA77_04845 [Sarocladium implicatum]|nr:hypothetical protein LIA77_04845 [Sarocladium implicatum]
MVEEAAKPGASPYPEPDQRLSPGIYAILNRVETSETGIGLICQKYSRGMAGSRSDLAPHYGCREIDKIRNPTNDMLGVA